LLWALSFQKPIQEFGLFPERERVIALKAVSKPKNVIEHYGFGIWIKCRKKKEERS
jgi:hypothetical protein